MRNLNSTIPEDSPEPQSELVGARDTALLAIKNGEASYAPQPVVVDDARLAKKLGNRFAWFHGDRGWTRLISAFGLHRVTEIASIEPIPGDPVDDTTRELTKRTEEASPYVLALVDV